MPMVKREELKIQLGLGLALVLLGVVLWKAGILDSLLSQLSEATDTMTREDRQLWHETWAGLYEIEELRCDAAQSAFAAGHYHELVPGVDPNSMGPTLTRAEYAAFIADVKCGMTDRWRQAPPDIRDRYERLYRKLGVLD